MKTANIEKGVSVRFTSELTHEEIELRFFHTKHSLERCVEREISNPMISLIISCGDCYYKDGLSFYIIGQENNYPNLSDDDFEKIKNCWILVGTYSNKIITCIRKESAKNNSNQKKAA